MNLIDVQPDANPVSLAQLRTLRDKAEKEVQLHAKRLLKNPDFINRVMMPLTQDDVDVCVASVVQWKAPDASRVWLRVFMDIKRTHKAKSLAAVDALYELSEQVHKIESELANKTNDHR